MNKIEQLQKQVIEIDEQINREIISDSYIIYDGIVDIEKYLNSRFKILWILKEPHDKGGSNGKGWDMRDLLKDAKYENGLNPDMKSTFTNIIYSTYGILNDFVSWDKMDYINDKPDMIDILQNIAIINLRKLPGEASSNDIEIANAYKKHKLLILKQIEVFNPDIIIGGGTIHNLYTDLKLSKVEKISLNKFDNIKNYPKAYFLPSKKIVIEVCHPAARIEQKKYCDNIINAVKEWSKK